MKLSIRIGVVLLVYACFIFFMACEQAREISMLPEETSVSAGKIHNELLENIFASLENCAEQDNEVTEQDKLDVAYEEQMRLAEKYGATALPRKEVMYHIQKGREYATMDPVMLASKVLDEEELQWFATFMMSAKPTNVRTVFDSLCAANGTPTPGSHLEHIIDIAISSSEFWLKERRDDMVLCGDVAAWAAGIDELSSHDLTEMLRRPWWQRLLRFTSWVGVDAISGFLAGTGGGGFVGGAIIGGLASYGADCLLWTNCDL